jgi:hypothetical protein
MGDSKRGEEDAASEDIACDGVASEDIASDDAASEDIASEDAASEDIGLDSAGVYYMSVEAFESRSTGAPQSADRESRR